MISLKKSKIEDHFQSPYEIHSSEREDSFKRIGIKLNVLKQANTNRSGSQL